MKVYLATDHAGFDLKEKVYTYLQKKGLDLEDLGAYEFDEGDDYPDFMSKAAEKVQQNPADKAIIFGGSGQGEAMAANKFSGVRAAVFYGPLKAVHPIDVTGNKSTDMFEILRLTREHNDANILSIGARFVTEEDVYKAIEVFLGTSFSGAERHKRRIEKMEKLT